MSVTDIMEGDVVSMPAVVKWSLECIDAHVERDTGVMDSTVKLTTDQRNHLNQRNHLKQQNYLKRLNKLTLILNRDSHVTAI